MKKNKKNKQNLIKKEKRKLKREFKEKWEKARQEVKDKQENRCYICQKKIFGRTANVHHIIDRRVKEFFFEPLNLILVCPRCHKLSPLAVHNTTIYFAEMLRKKEPERYNYLIRLTNLLEEKK